MASNDSAEGVAQQSIQFVDPSNTAPARLKTTDAATPDAKASLVSEKISDGPFEGTNDIDDEEKARQIADDDLNKKRKQVSRPVASMPS